MNADARDVAWMRLALAQARRGVGDTAPNPPVGAVVVAGGRVVGKGYHHRAGAPHAEVLACRQAGARAAGATLYVTLEPCSTTGRTPPCTDLLLRAGFARVVLACRDPNPRHRGRGIRLLRTRGVQVDEGVCRAEALDLIRPFASWVARGRPHLTLKLAMTLDGRLADREGRSKWITGLAARREVQRLRRACDAVMVGAGTVVADDPSLVSRLRRDVPRRRVIVDLEGRTPATARVLTDAHAALTVVATTGAVARRRGRAWSRRGARVWALPVTPAPGGSIDLDELLRRLAAEGIAHVLCEGGAGLAGSLARAGLVDEAVLFVAPTWLADEGAVGCFRGAGALLDGALRLRFQSVRRVGRDLMVTARPERGRRACSPG